MKLIGRIFLMLGLAIGLLAIPAAAQAKVAAPTPTGNEVGIQAGCHVHPKGDLVNIRRYPRTSAERIGILYSGNQADALCDAVSGGSYTACGGTSSWWVPVNWNGARGYVAWRCVYWHVDH
ncbi:MAG: SH3 domain-containing protein [Micromonosporaceae bacterium]